MTKQLCTPPCPLHICAEMSKQGMCSLHPEGVLTSNEYLGLDRDELREIIGERDAKIERLRAALEHANRRIIHLDGALRSNANETKALRLDETFTVPEFPLPCGCTYWTNALGQSGRRFCDKHHGMLRQQNPTECKHEAARLTCSDCGIDFPRGSVEETTSNEANATSSGVESRSPTPRGTLPNSLGASSGKASTPQLTDAQNEAMDRDIMEAIKRDDAQKAPAPLCKCGRRSPHRFVEGECGEVKASEQCPAIDGPHRTINGVCIHCRAQVNGKAES